jgi:hypothetical protein
MVKLDLPPVADGRAFYACQEETVRVSLPLEKLCN